MSEKRSVSKEDLEQWANDFINNKEKTNVDLGLIFNRHKKILTDSLKSELVYSQFSAIEDDPEMELDDEGFLNNGVMKTIRERFWR